MLEPVSDWEPSSWRSRPALQQPDWPDLDALEARFAPYRDRYGVERDHRG